MKSKLAPYTFLASPADRESGMTLDPWTLKFVDSSAKLESPFLFDYCLGALQHGRIAVIFGALMVAVFGIMDVLILTDNLDLILAIRFGFIIPFMLSFFLFTYTDVFVKFIDLSMTGMVSFTGLALSVIVVVAPQEVSPTYFAGNMLVIFFAYGFLRLRFIWANVAGWSVVLGFITVDLIGGSTPFDEQLMRVFFNSSTCLLGMFVAYSSEYYARRNYFLRHVLAERKTDLEENHADLEKRVQERTEEALTAVRAKSNFLANMSHEIRTPMNGVLGMLELLKDAELSVAQKEQINTAYQSAEGLLEIINDVLDVSKIEAGKMKLNLGSVSPGALIEDVCMLMSPQIHAKQLQLVHELAPEAYDSYILDGTRLRQIILNLLGNALKFTDRGSIRVSCEVKHNNLEIQVCDTGIGILPEHQDHLFDAFSQADNSAARAFGGTGLGLSITKQLTELMGGHIEVTSQLSMGSTFKLSIPTNKTDPVKSHANLMKKISASKGKSVFFLVESKYQSKAIRNLLERLECEISTLENADIAITDLGAIDCGNIPVICLGEQTESEFHCDITNGEVTRYLQFPVTITSLSNALELKNEEKIAVKKQPPVKYSQRTVLLVEDNVVNQKVADAMLVRLGVNAHIVSGGLEALASIKNNEFDLILMDCQMPGMDGFETTEAIRQYESKNSQRKTAIVALTANAMEGDRERCLNSGMDDYLAKPINLAGLHQIFQRWM